MPGCRGRDRRLCERRFQHRVDLRAAAEPHPNHGRRNKSDECDDPLRSRRATASGVVVVARTQDAGRCDGPDRHRHPGLHRHAGSRYRGGPSTIPDHQRSALEVLFGGGRADPIRTRKLERCNSDRSSRVGFTIADAIPRTPSSRPQSCKCDSCSPPAHRWSLSAVARRRPRARRPLQARSVGRLPFPPHAVVPSRR